MKGDIMDIKHFLERGNGHSVSSGSNVIEASVDTEGSPSQDKFLPLDEVASG